MVDFWGRPETPIKFGLGTRAGDRRIEFWCKKQVVPSGTMELYWTFVQQQLHDLIREVAGKQVRAAGKTLEMAEPSKKRSENRSWRSCSVRRSGT
jgi:hypothetical protein